MTDIMCLARIQTAKLKTGIIAIRIALTKGMTHLKGGYPRRSKLDSQQNPLVTCWNITDIVAEYRYIIS